MKPALCMLVILLLGSPACAMFMGPTYAPVDRLAKNAAAYIEENPDDAQGYYVLGRVHTLAFVGREARLGHYPDRQSTLPRIDVPFGPIEIPGRQFGRGGPQADDDDDQPQPRPVTLEILREHLTLAIENLERAVELEPKNAVYRLGLAYAYELATPMAMMGQPPALVVPAEHPMPADQQAIQQQIWKLINPQREDVIGEKDAAPPPAVDVDALLAEGDDLLAVLLTLTAQQRGNPTGEQTRQVLTLLEKVFRERTIAHYLAAYELSLARDLAQEHQPLLGLWALASYEAGHAYLRLTEARGVRADEAKQVAEVEENLNRLATKPMGPITPILMSFEAHERLADLLATNAAVRFDLDGDGHARRWRWVKPTTGILVWDPQGAGRVNSGRQLFGSVTFWMFWRNGYDALDALDDDRDGRLTGEELRGLAVWFDANQDGVSDPGEVRTVQTLGVRAIRTHATGTDGDAPMNLQGVEMTDGRTIPTYDWIAQEATD